MAYAAISKPSLHMNTVLYTGDGSGATVSGVGFQPDLNWTKSRSDVLNHAVTDSGRGVQKTLYTNLDAEQDDVTNGLTAFNADGYVHGDHALWATNTATYASWNWKANGAGSLNEVGTINSTVSVNTTNGFSLATYTGNGSTSQTVGHGLGVAPAMILMKAYDSSAYWWWMSHRGMSAVDKSLHINEINDESTNAQGITARSSTTFGVGNDTGCNSSGYNYVAYSFAQIKGYSRFGSYTGNGSTDGSVVYCGFKPAWLMIKCTSHDADWEVLDNKRSPENVANEKLLPNSSAIESTSTANQVDFLSNGFKIRASNDETNGSGRSYIFAAFAEEPLVANVGANGIPATAR